MNKPLSPKDVTEPKVTTGPLSGSRKIYSSPDGHADLRVPLREIALSGEEPLQGLRYVGALHRPRRRDRREARAAAVAQAWVEARGVDRGRPSS